MYVLTYVGWTGMGHLHTVIDCLNGSFVHSITDPSEALAMTLLSRLLVDGQASPFYQALIESKLGSRYSPGTG